MSSHEIQKLADIFENIDIICRTCLKMSANLNALSSKITLDNHKMTLMDLILQCAPIEICEYDGFPQKICKSCEKAAINSHIFRRQCDKSSKYLDTIKAKLGKKQENLLKRVEENRAQSSEGDQSLRARLHPHILSPADDIVKETENSILSKHSCAICQKDFVHRSSMLRHKKRHNAAPSTCPYCSFKPLNSTVLAKHMEANHAHFKTHQCELCNKSFFKNTNLQRHLQIHEGVKKHTCEICGMSFVARSNLIVHRRLHTGEKPYTCSWCGRSFTQHSALRSHEAGHQDKKEHVCPECGIGFSRAGALRNHRKRHSSTKPFECSICSRKFTFSSERKRHMMIHTGDKNYECEVCGSRFTRNNNLKVHMRIHTGETPHVCEICGKGFSQVHCLKMHKSSHSSDVR